MHFFSASFIKALLLPILVAISVNAISQKNRWGILVNATTTNYYYGENNSTLQSYKKNYRGIQAGVTYQAGIMKQFSLISELYLSVKGGTLKQNNPLTGQLSTLRLITVEMPLLARRHFGNFYINAGPYITYNWSGRIKAERSFSSITKLTFGNNPEQFKRWEWGAQAGMGYGFNIKKVSLSADVRYGYGFSSISNTVNRYSRMLNISITAAKPVWKHKKNGHTKAS